MTLSQGLWIFVVVIALAFFAYNVQRFAGYLGLGIAENRLDAIAVRFRNFIEIGILQKKIFRDSVAGPMHAAIFWGFCVITAGTVEFGLHVIVPSFTFRNYLPDWLYRFYALNQDLWGVLVLGAVALALTRRL